MLRHGLPESARPVIAPVRVAALLAATLVLAGCTVGGSVATAPLSSSAATASAPAESTLTTTPATTASSEATPGPSSTGAPSIAPTGTPSPAPRAELVAVGATVAGILGTFTLDGSGSDSPWLPFDVLPAVGVGASEVLTVRFVDRAAIGDVQVEIAAAADTTGSAPRGIDGALGDVGLSYSFGPLPAGRWVVAAHLFRADGRGNGLTFWAVTVR